MANVRIHEKVHHGRYLNRRIMEVTELNHRTVNALLESSPYAYTQVDPERIALIIDDLKTHGRAELGWSTFTIEESKP